jgi:F-type H+-transporting ATPase subunit a
MSANNNHSEQSEQIIHETTIFAEPIFNVGSFTVTNSLINSVMAVIVLALFFIAAGRKIRKIPSGIQNFFEMLLEGALNFADSVTGSRKKSEQFLPLVLSLFFFILVNNWLGLLPGVGTIGFVEVTEEGKVFIPLFRGATADLNTTLALALLAVVSTHVFGAMAIGGWSHLNKFFNINAILEIPKKFKKDKNISFINPIKAFVGLIEFVGEFARVASLSLRLFGNIFAGEVLLASMMAIFAFFLPLPFMFLEVLVGVIQASVFSILTLVFLSMSTSHQEH